MDSRNQKQMHNLVIHLLGKKSNLIDFPIILSHAVRAECSCEQGSMMELTKQFLATFYCLVCHVLTVHSSRRELSQDLQN